MLNYDSPLYDLFVQLRGRSFLVGMEDYSALRQAVSAGFGLTSRVSLRDLCCSLWAKTKSEREVLKALFDQLPLPEWDVNDDSASDPFPKSDHPLRIQTEGPAQRPPGAEDKRSKVRPPSTWPKRGLPPINLDDLDLAGKTFVFAPHFPLTERDMARRWEHSRGSLLSGPLEEIDVSATVALRCRQGVSGPVILKPRKRKIARLLLLVDRQGSMVPFHKFVDIVLDSIKRSRRSREAAVYYFHDVPVDGTNDQILASVRWQPFPVLDGVLDEIVTSGEGYIYDDEELLSPKLLPEVLRSIGKDVDVVFLSDAGAARRRYDPQRLLDTVAFIKFLRSHGRRCVWLNPLPASFWKGTTAEQIARHMPMFGLDDRGLQHAIGVLRGNRHPVEIPL